MKATIDSTGNLTVIAECELESYALDKWFEDWLLKKSTMQIAVKRGENPSTTTYKNIKNVYID